MNIKSQTPEEIKKAFEDVGTDYNREDRGAHRISGLLRPEAGGPIALPPARGGKKRFLYY
jgi:hypothetical protein